LHQQDVNHRAFVDDQQIAFERIVLGSLEAEGLGVEFQQAVDGLRLHPKA